jgi:bacillithiol system protein YtxJ
LTSLEDWENTVAASQEASIIVFKHSTRCSVSRMALKLTERHWDLPSDVQAYLLDLLNHRDVSNAIAADLGVEHASPQLLCIRNSKCVFSANHGNIDPVDVKPYL